MRRLDSRNEERYYYIEGNAARKLNTVPQREVRPNRQPAPERERKTNARVEKNAQRAKAFDLRYTMALVVATVFLFGACVNMLSLQADITEQRRQIALLESNLNELKDTNNETSKRLDSSVDLTKVYDFATQELGMVYPGNDQVVSYKASNPDYVKQFKDVPKE
ncbi:MAG: cell division protein FtsL [Lachnospiraceae bacterium]|nr:cell division protein FtsL [Lachnospiraceae bacterium]